MKMQQTRERRVVVIGGAGFLGSHMVNYLIDELSCRVTVLDNLINGKEKHIHPQADFEWWDIRDDERQLADLLKKRNIELVFNYAAEPFLPDSFDRPGYVFEINASAVLTVLNACQLAGVKKILQVSSAEIYGCAHGKISEDAPIKPHSTYGVSKVAADGLVQVRHREVGVPAVILRQFNCIGERPTHSYVVPDMISQFASGPEVHLGNNSERDFLYAGDAVRMAAELMEKGTCGEAYNMGSETSVSIYDLAYQVGRLMGHSDPKIIEDDRRVRPWEIWHLQSDNSKLYGVIDSRPQTEIMEAVRKTVDYFYANGERWDF